MRRREVGWGRSEGGRGGREEERNVRGKEVGREGGREGGRERGRDFREGEELVLRV
jgi:hypothetical protein